MRLKQSEIDLPQKLWEFDIWVTPSLTDIRGTKRFKEELDRIISTLDAITAGGTTNFPAERYAASLVDSAFAHLDNITSSDTDAVAVVTKAGSFLNSLSALLFLVTGKSDNNIKCQFPIFLRNIIGISTLPNVKMLRGKARLVADDIPRVIDSESYMTRVARIYTCCHFGYEGFSEHGDAAKTLLLEFTSLLLADVASRAQLSAFLSQHNRSRINGDDPSILLTPLVIFQVRGSVAASGGHEPEQILRSYMQSWGMIRDIDFNINDVVLDVEAGRLREKNGEESEPAGARTKTRAYDFVLPFRTPQWTPRIFIQSQFYAGDSGSVSHKNVDQTSSSRQSATKLLAKTWPEGPLPVFLEYVDGAGYSASLNSDLKSLLTFTDTSGFFQIRSAPIRLRRELQKIGFLTPLEIAHAILLVGESIHNIKQHLIAEEYSLPEIDRAIEVAYSYGFLRINDDKIEISPLLFPTARKILLLDIISQIGRPFEFPPSGGVVLVPGYGPNYGVNLSELDEIAKGFEPFSRQSEGYMKDLQELCRLEWVILR